MHTSSHMPPAWSRTRRHRRSWPLGTAPGQRSISPGDRVPGRSAPATRSGMRRPRTPRPGSSQPGPPCRYISGPRRPTFFPSSGIRLRRPPARRPDPLGAPPRTGTARPGTRPHSTARSSAAAAARPGVVSPVNSTSIHPFFRSVCDSSPSRYARPCRRTATFPNSPATCANNSLNDSDHAACASTASTRASSTTLSMHRAWSLAPLRSRSHAE